jgi:hypothetical protein
MTDLILHGDDGNALEGGTVFQGYVALLHARIDDVAIMHSTYDFDKSANGLRRR